MCLTKVETIYETPLTDTKIGYKVFDTYNNKLTFWLNYERVIEKDWNEDNNDYMLTNGSTGQSYPTGYHIYDSINAININLYRKTCYKVCRVQYTNIIVKGMNVGMGYGITERAGDEYLCFIARKFKILETLI